jgi:hypothetical protein
MQSVLDTAAKLTEAIRDAHRRRPFETAVHDFVRLLATIPDYPAKDFSGDTLRDLKTLAEDVIANIENRLSANADSSADQQQLASGVYEIRRLLEEINLWRRHYLGTP